MKNLIVRMCLLTLVAACSSGPLVKAALDDEVRRLCAIDGGIKVYETVTLSADKFNQWRQVNFYRPTQGEEALGKAYRLVTTKNYFRTGNPEMSRLHIQVFRARDDKLLGESISYGRGGGDMPGPWHDSSYHCPERNYGEVELFSKIFVAFGGEGK